MAMVGASSKSGGSVSPSSKGGGRRAGFEHRGTAAEEKVEDL